jgi:hypothetical protein
VAQSTPCVGVPLPPRLRARASALTSSFPSPLPWGEALLVSLFLCRVALLLVSFGLSKVAEPQ